MASSAEKFTETDDPLSLRASLPVVSDRRRLAAAPNGTMPKRSSATLEESPVKAPMWSRFAIAAVFDKRETGRQPNRYCS
jgi:hypothetical protein